MTRNREQGRATVPTKWQDEVETSKRGRRLLTALDPRRWSLRTKRVVMVVVAALAVIVIAAAVSEDVRDVVGFSLWVLGLIPVGFVVLYVIFFIADAFRNPTTEEDIKELFIGFGIAAAGGVIALVGYAVNPSLDPSRSDSDPEQVSATPTAPASVATSAPGPEDTLACQVISESDLKAVVGPFELEDTLHSRSPLESTCEYIVATPSLEGFEVPETVMPGAQVLVSVHVEAKSHLSLSDASGELEDPTRCGSEPVTELSVGDEGCLGLPGSEFRRIAMACVRRESATACIYVQPNPVSYEGLQRAARIAARNLPTDED